MVRLLRVYFWVVLAAMLAVTLWAQSQVSLFDIPGAVGGHPWFIATLFDAYFGFFAFWIFIVYKERSAGRSAAWFVALVLLGNIAMAVYALLLLRRLPPGAPLSAVFEPRRTA
jgi:hypothetical protein